MTLRFGLDGRSRTLQQTAEELGYKFGETARRIEARALRKITHTSRTRMLKGFLE